MIYDKPVPGTPPADSNFILQLPYTGFFGWRAEKVWDISHVAFVQLLVTCNPTLLLITTQYQTFGVVQGAWATSPAGYAYLCPPEAPLIQYNPKLVQIAGNPNASQPTIHIWG